MSDDPNEWFDGRARVMFVHAHPDDAQANRKCPFLDISRLRRARLGLGDGYGLVGRDAQ